MLSSTPRGDTIDVVGSGPRKLNMDDEAYKSFLERQSDVRRSEDLRELMDVSVETITRVSQMGRPRVKAMMLKRIEKDGKRSISPTGSILRFVAETESAMAPMSEPERRDFWEICEDRYQVRSMILTSQLPVPRWHEQIGDANRGRWHPRPAGSQRASHRDAWRFDAQESWKAEHIAITGRRGECRAHRYRVRADRVTVSK